MHVSAHPLTQVEENYEVEEEVMDLLIEMSALIAHLAERGQPKYLQTKLLSVLARSVTVINREMELTEMH